MNSLQFCILISTIHLVMLHRDDNEFLRFGKNAWLVIGLIAALLEIYLRS